MHINNIFYHLMVKLIPKQWSQYRITYSSLTLYTFSCGHKDWHIIIYTARYRAIIYETHLWAHTGSPTLSQHYRDFDSGHKGCHTITYSSIYKGLIHLTHLPDTEPIQDQTTLSKSNARIVMEPYCINVQSRLHTKESKTCENIATRSFNDIQETTLTNLH